MAFKHSIKQKDNLTERLFLCTAIPFDMTMEAIYIIPTKLTFLANNATLPVKGLPRQEKVWSLSKQGGLCSSCIFTVGTLTMSTQTRVMVNNFRFLPVFIFSVKCNAMNNFLSLLGFEISWNLFHDISRKENHSKRVNFSLFASSRIWWKLTN